MTKIKPNKIELLSPAGNMKKLKTALAFGADAVYAGIPDFSLRVRINDFNIESIREAVAYCHKKKKKIYITVNIFAHNKHLTYLPIYIKKLKSFKVDALIVSDPGVLRLVQKYWPECEIHLSTQANCTNWQAACFWYDLGVKRIILGREVTMSEIIEIHKRCPEVELEYFVHGAMCMAYSGRCFLSSYLRGRSANLGDCTQPCRWQYEIRPWNEDIKEDRESFVLTEEKHGSYILNSNDLNLLPYLYKLQKAGISSFKIEGRAKSVYYQAMVAGIYATVLKNRVSKEEITFLAKELMEKLTHRGYTTGFLFNKRGGQNLKTSHNLSVWEFCGEVKKSVKISQQKYKIYIKVHNTIKQGDMVEIVMPLYDIMKIKVDKLFSAQTNELLTEAHGGQDKEIFFIVGRQIPRYSVVRRKTKK